MRILFLLVLLIAGCIPVHTPPTPLTSVQQYYGFDTLALARLDPAPIIQEMPNGGAIGALEKTFGDPLPNMERIARSGRLGAFRVHLINWTCRRNRNCESSEPKTDRYGDTLRSLSKKWQAFAVKYPHIKCFLSPLLEYDERSSSTVNKYASIIQSYAPSCKVVLSPTSAGAIPNGYLVERHGNKARADIVSNDGENIFDSNSVDYRTRGNLITFAWFPRLNMRVSGEKSFTPPSKRKHKPTKSNYRQAVRLLVNPEPPKPPKPSVCSTSRELQGSELWKTNAEDYNNGDPRGDRPLLISKSRSSQIDILAPSGKKIGCAKYYGPYGTSGLYRHYVGSCSRDSGVSLMDKAGSEWVFLKDRSNCLLVNAIRRKGYFR